MLQFLIVCPLTFLAGVVDSIAGGGGLISLPAFLIAGVPVHFAVGTNKLSSSMGTVISTARYVRHGYIRGREAIRIAVFAVLAALIGSTVGSTLSLMVSEQLLKNMMIVILPVVAYYVLRNKNLDEASGREPLSTPLTLAVTVLAAFVIGCYDGFYGPGTGTFLILALTGAARLDLKRAEGLTKVINLTSNVTALVNFMINGKVDYRLGLCAGCFCIVGHYLGAGLVVHNGQRIVRPMLLVVLAILFVKILSGM
ncbi:MAG: TSUP family transporter [Clostridiales bacterium]|nr:TSUP family transporter [Clostridiales bacterium]